jgi:hypothetical protein
MAREYITKILLVVFLEARMQVYKPSEQFLERIYNFK